MKQYILSSFTRGSEGGNKAAVVFDDYGLSENQMKSIAAVNNLSETAFIDIHGSKDNCFNIRYFTPTEEVDICGHAALASFYILKELRYIKSGEVYHKTKAGRLRVLMEEDKILIRMKRPEVASYLDIEDIVECTDLKKKNIIAHNNKIEVISAGLKDIILEVDSLEALKTMNVNREKLIELCTKNQLIGMHVVSRETIEADSDYCTRNFAPAVGIDEESATGTSNAAMLYYMLLHDDSFDFSKVYRVEQGYFMNSPSNIYVKAEEKEEIEIYVGGKAVILESTELDV